MNKTAKLTILAVVVIAVMALTILFMESAPKQGSQDKKHAAVSLTPSVTEMLYQLKLHDRIVGISKYCKPGEGSSEPTRCGTAITPDYETITALKPELVVSTKVKGGDVMAEKLKADGIKTVTLDHSSLKGILNSYSVLGKTFDCEKTATKLQSKMEAELKSISSACLKSGKKPKVLLCFFRKFSNGEFTRMCFAANDRYFNDILASVGAENVLADAATAYPQASVETVLKYNPDVIIELTEPLETELSQEQILTEWKKLVPECSAVKNRRVYIISKDYATVPGPGVIRLIRDLAELLHPECDWKRAL